MKGRQTSSPERHHLDGMSDIAERENWDSVHPELMDSLYELRKRTSELENLSDYSQAASNQHKQYWLPVADRTREFLRLLLQPRHTR